MNRTIDEAYDALRANASHRLGKLAQRMNGSFTWDDLVLPEHIKKGLEDFTFEGDGKNSFLGTANGAASFPTGKKPDSFIYRQPGDG